MGTKETEQSTVAVNMTTYQKQQNQNTQSSLLFEKHNTVTTRFVSGMKEKHLYLKKMEKRKYLFLSIGIVVFAWTIILGLWIYLL